MAGTKQKGNTLTDTIGTIGSKKSGGKKGVMSRGKKGKSAPPRKGGY